MATAEHEIVVRVAEGGAEGFIGRARCGDVSSQREDESPYEAAWNALADVMTQLGYDQEGLPA